MNLNIVARGVSLSEALEAEIERMVEDAVADYRHHVNWVVVSVVRGGGGPIACSLDMGLSPKGRLRFAEIDHDIMSGFSEATAQARLALGPFIESVLEGQEPVVPADPPRDLTSGEG